MSNKWETSSLFCESNHKSAPQKASWTNNRLHSWMFASSVCKIILCTNLWGIQHKFFVCSHTFRSDLYVWTVCEWGSKMSHIMQSNSVFSTYPKMWNKNRSQRPKTHHCPVPVWGCTCSSVRTHSGSTRTPSSPCTSRTPQCPTLNKLRHSVCLFR